jgi:GntR family transcriptional repressor for pyruvate dehydrogenase complex
MDGRFPASSRLPAERALSVLLGVSRSALREALQRLAARGLIQMRQGSGVYVTDTLHGGSGSPWHQLLSAHAHLGHDMLEFRQTLEVAAAELAAERATREDLARIAALVKQLEQARRNDDEDAETALDVDFHHAIADAAHNAMFSYLQANFVAMHREHIADNQAGLRHGDARVADALWRQHQAVWQAIRDGDAKQAGRRMRAHILFVRRRLSQQGSGQPAAPRPRPRP